jgi:hypothetical protein
LLEFQDQKIFPVSTVVVAAAAAAAAAVVDVACVDYAGKVVLP